MPSNRATCANFEDTRAVMALERPILGRLQLLTRFRKLIALLQQSGLGWEQILAALSGVMQLGGELGIEIPKGKELLALVELSRQFALIEGTSEEAVKAKLGITILAAQRLAQLTPSTEDDALVAVIANFAQDERIEKVLVYVFSQVLRREQAPLEARAMLGPPDYLPALDSAERMGLLGGGALPRVRRALPELIDLFRSLMELADLFPKLQPAAG